MAQVAWTPVALSQLFNICTLIAWNSEARAAAFANEAFDKTDLLSQHPELGQEFIFASESNLRRLVYGEYVIAYRIVGHFVQILVSMANVICGPSLRIW